MFADVKLVEDYVTLRPSVRPSVTLVDCDHIQRGSSTSILGRVGPEVTKGEPRGRSPEKILSVICTTVFDIKLAYNH